MENNTQSISPVFIEDEMRQSYMDYAMSVIVGRALPDVRDGLKPVHRRIVYAMFSEGLQSNKKHSKCAGVVGEVLKRLHPHGDAPVYEALVRLAQPWNLRYPLIDGQGNFGSIDGDPAAAYRYTECRMTAISEQLLEDLGKETVDFIPNFDGSNIEPVVLPAAYPNLLVNGSDGIAVGMATRMPPHNLTEVISGTIALIENPEIDVAGLMKHIPGPDFPTGGIISGRSSIVSAYSNGRGVVQMRAKASIETLKKKSRDCEAIIITEIPYQVNKARLIEKVADLVNDKKIEGISNIRDESDRKGMRVVFELKRDADSGIVLNQLFKLTPMQSSFGIINLAIVDGRPVVLSLKQLLGHFINHRRDVIVRSTQYDLRKALERMHLLEGFRIALLNLDAVIDLIKKSETPKEAKDGLMAKYKLSDIQAQAILDLRLQKLTGMERLAIEQEHAELAKEIDRLNSILADSKNVDKIIVDRLAEIKSSYGDDRRTVITDQDSTIEMEDLVEDEEMVISISHKGYIKRTASTNFKSQKRGGKGVTGASTKDEDFTIHLFVSSNKADLLFFTSSGRLHWVKVYEIPEASRIARGRALINLLNLKGSETVTAVLPVKEYSDSQFVFMTTKNGFIKRVNLSDFSRPRRGGIIAANLDDGDALIGVGITNGKNDILLATANGMAIRFAEEDARVMGRNARGVRGIRLEMDDKLVSMTVAFAEVLVPEKTTTPVKTEESSEGGVEAVNIEVEEKETLFTVCQNGFGKRTRLSDYRCQARGGKGVIDIQTEGRNGPVVTAHLVTNDKEAMLITSGGKLIRIKANEISVIGRNTRGVRLIDLDEGEAVLAFALLAERDEDEVDPVPE
ncbi:MAG: DNA gyrase subunit A [bacterium]|nr:DNA gyrase subunit A [bacterium]